jgi:single-strand DNA-binding protein
MINRIVLVGRVVDKPELRYTGNGIAVAQFTLAVERPFKNPQGERETDFIEVVAWRERAEFASNYLDRGRWAGVEGRLQIRSYQTQEGQTRKVAEVVADGLHFVGPRPDSQEAAPAAPPPQRAPAAQPRAAQPAAGTPAATQPAAPFATGGRVSVFDADFDDEDDPFADQ